MHPLVSCIMPTSAGRPHFRPSAVECFLAQSYEPRELIVLTDANFGGWKALTAYDGRVRVCPSPAGLTLGEKRNLACELARGEIIAHFDDDDYSAPQRVSRQVHLLEQAPLTGYSSLLYYDVRDGSVWRFAAKGYDYAVGATLAYRKSWWEKNRFPAKNIGEDNEVVYASAARGELLHSEAEGMIVARIHGLNTSPKTTWAGDQWKRARLEELPDAFRASLRHGAAAA